MDAHPAERVFGGGGELDLYYAAQLPAIAVPFTGLAASIALYTGRCILTGAVVFNSATSSAQFNLRNGLDANGAPLWLTSIGASSRQQPVLPAQGVLADIGVYADLGAGVFAGSIFVIPLWWYKHALPKGW